MKTSDLYLVELTIPMVVQATGPEDARIQE